MCSSSFLWAKASTCASQVSSFDFSSARFSSAISLIKSTLLLLMLLRILVGDVSMPKLLNQEYNAETEMLNLVARLLMFSPVSRYSRITLTLKASSYASLFLLLRFFYAIFSHGLCVYYFRRGHDTRGEYMDLGRDPSSKYRHSVSVLHLIFRATSQHILVNVREWHFVQHSLHIQ